MIEELIKARDLIEQQWCQGVETGKNCAVYALGKAVGTDLDWDENLPKCEALIHYVERINKIEGYLVNWNDAPGRTKDEVVEAFNKAIDYAIIKRARDLIAVGWCQKLWKDTIDGVECYCIWGSMCPKVTTKDDARATERLSKMLFPDAEMPVDALIRWNDDPRNSKENVLKVLDAVLRLENVKITKGEVTHEAA